MNWYNDDLVDDDIDEKIWNIPREISPLINVLSFGWLEDGRCGLAANHREGKASSSPHDNSSPLQPCPHPLGCLEKYKPLVCKSVAAGSRHSLFLMIDSTPRLRDAPNKARTRQVLVAGLCQRGLCQDSGFFPPQPIKLDRHTDEAEYDPIVNVTAGDGCSFILTKNGKVYSFGHNKFGILCHGHEDAVTSPQRVLSLERERITSVVAGFQHVLAVTENSQVLGWGRNHKGQLGRGFESPWELIPAPVAFPPVVEHCDVLSLSCGQDHSICLLSAPKRADSGIDSLVYCWGDGSRGQLGSGDVQHRCKPQENVWVSRMLRKLRGIIVQVVAGGYHNLALIKGSGLVLSWGAGEYGQLGRGEQFDDPAPQIISSLSQVTVLAAGLRHSIAVSSGSGGVQAFAWGFNGFGELGLGDVDIRLYPTRITALRTANGIIQASCGARHTILVTNPRPLQVQEMPGLRPIFRILTDEKNNPAILSRLKRVVAKDGLDPSLLDNPMAIMPSQVGSNSEEVRNDRYEQGLRYCMDTFHDVTLEWRRKSMEACFECYLPNGRQLRSVCLACARNCVAHLRLRPYIRRRGPGNDRCDCRNSGFCKSKWSTIRAEFDRICGDDGFVAPRQLRTLLKDLRKPFPVENSDVDDALMQVADGEENATTPRIDPVRFERWYRKYYDEPGNVDDGSLSSVTSLQIDDSVSIASNT